MKNITKILITILSLTLLFAVGCSNDDKTGGGTGGDLPEATGENVTGLENRLGFQGTLTSDNTDIDVNYFFNPIGIENNQIQNVGGQLKWPDSANKKGGKILMYIKMTFDNSKILKQRM